MSIYSCSQLQNLNFTFQSTVSTRNVQCTVEQQAGFLATKQLSLCRARNSIQSAQKRYELEIYKRIGKVRHEKDWELCVYWWIGWSFWDIEAGKWSWFNCLNVVTRSAHCVQAAYKACCLDYWWLRRALLPTGKIPLRPDSVSLSDIQNKNLERKTLFVPKILDHYLGNDSQYELQLNWGPIYKTTWEVRNNVPREELSKCFHCMHMVVADRF